MNETKTIDVLDHYRRVWEKCQASVKAKLRLLGAADAEAMLVKMNTNKRPYSANLGAYYARLMATGQWDCNGEPIILADDGEPLNAQHRLHGLTLAEIDLPGIRVPFLVVTGVCKSMFRSMDTGKSRTGKDILAIAGEHNCGTLSAMCDFVWRWEDSGGDMLASVNTTKRVGGAERLQMVEQNPGMRESASLLHNNLRGRLPNPSVWASLHYLTIQKHPRRAADFWEQVMERTTIPHNSPVWHLHQRLKKQSVKEPMGKRETVVIITKAWNAFVEGRAVQEIRWKVKKDHKGKTVPEPCPKLSDGSKAAKEVSETLEAQNS